MEMIEWLEAYFMKEKANPSHGDPRPLLFGARL